MDRRILIFLLRGLLLGLFAVVVSGCAGGMKSGIAPDGPSTVDGAVIEPDVARREIDPPKIDTDDFEIGGFVGLMSVEDFETNPAYGLRLDYHITEKFFVEGNYGQTTVGESSYEKLSGGAQLLADDQRELTYYDLSVGYNLLPGEAFIGRNRAFNGALYVLAGAGNTDFAGDNHFTWMLGAGYRMLVWRAMAMHFNFRDHIWDSDLLGESKTTHNIELSLGLSFFF
jgi:outer membrane beta-barrel protein